MVNINISFFSVLTCIIRKKELVRISSTEYGDLFRGKRQKTRVYRIGEC